MKKPLPRRLFVNPAKSIGDIKQALATDYDPNQFAAPTNNLERFVTPQGKIEQSSWIWIGGDHAHTQFIDSISPLQWAIRRGALEVVRLLVDAGADISDTMVGLMVMSLPVEPEQSQFVEIVKLLLSQQVTLKAIPMRLRHGNFVDCRLSTPLSALITQYNAHSCACFRSLASVSIIETLLENKYIDVNAVNPDGSTALTCFLWNSMAPEIAIMPPHEELATTIHRNRLRIFLALLKAGADVGRMTRAMTSIQSFGTSKIVEDVVGYAIEQSNVPVKSYRLAAIPYIAAVGLWCIDRIIVFNALLMHIHKPLISIVMKYQGTSRAGQYFESATQRLLNPSLNMKPCSKSDRTAATKRAGKLRIKSLVTINKQGCTPLEYAVCKKSFNNVLCITQNLRKAWLFQSTTQKIPVSIETDLKEKFNAAASTS